MAVTTSIEEGDSTEAQDHDDGEKGRSLFRNAIMSVMGRSLLHPGIYPNPLSHGGGGRRRGGTSDPRVMVMVTMMISVQ